MTPAPTAQAAATTLHVCDIATCTDAGDGSATTPFCTVQAAADVVEPGQVVDITGTQDETVTITRSGTADAPIVFEGGAVRRPTGSTAPTITATSESLLTTARSWPLVVVPAGGTLNPGLTVSRRGGMTVVFDADPGGSPRNIAATTFDFGDGKTETVTGEVSQHRYDLAGTYQVRATATDAGGNTATTTTSVATLGSGYVKHGPTRFLDTRTGVGAPVRKVAPYSTVRLAVGGRHGVPADVTAVAMNLTVTGTTVDGYLTAHPSGQARLTASVVDFRASGTVPGLTTVAVGAGHVDLFNGSPGTVDLISDVTGYFAKAATAEGFTPVHPSRLLDTRNGLGAVSPRPVVAGETFTQRVAGHYTGDVPGQATAALLTVVVVGPRAPGHLTVHPSGTANPQTSSLNYSARPTTTNSVIVPSADGHINLYANATTDVVIDVIGYFARFGKSYLVPVSPIRAVDTRGGIGGPDGAPPGRSNTQYTLDQGAPKLDFGPTAVIFNAKVVNPRRGDQQPRRHRAGDGRVLQRERRQPGPRGRRDRLLLRALTRRRGAATSTFPTGRAARSPTRVQPDRPPSGALP
ncbi:PKD domain-containing protein [Saccharothrix texasensis]|uniref:PKD domain-containing protein n=1 Tax=Saccharothrix texasensis TaxID=103734 RepID=A0A3N1HHQ3_9PSEU|nr:PKD domain-containing protein [Saccharothrix texasensis]ROP41971.1 PKD domain-containing protein [Saccharothrix texasensis]